MPPNRRRSTDPWMRAVVVGVPVLTFFGGALFNAWGIADKLATKPYVDDKFVEGKHYVDMRVEQSFKDAIEHSDANRQQMVLRMEQVNTETKATQATLSTKIDAILHALDLMGSRRGGR